MADNNGGQGETPMADFMYKCETDQLRNRIAELEDEKVAWETQCHDLREENSQLKGRFADGFNAGRKAERSNNRSGCCCQFDGDDNIISFCMAHKEIIDNLKAEIAKLKRIAQDDADVIGGKG